MSAGVPQADEQQRLFANTIIQSNISRKPLPRLWYLPGNNKAAIVYTVDDHSTESGTKDIFNKLCCVNSPVGGNPSNWTAYRGTSWFYVGIPLSDSMAAIYNTQGFEMGVHVTNNRQDSYFRSRTLMQAMLRNFNRSTRTFRVLPARNHPPFPLYCVE